MNDDSGLLRDFPKKELTLQDIGIVNRRSARQAGLRNPKKPRKMAVPKAKR